jgi:arsenite-transporting ATPase
VLLTVRHLLDRRVLFFGGKGGVGKTTCAAAVSLAAARAGRRVLLVSTDPAHSTSDIFERPFAREEREILPSLSGLEVDAQFEARRYLDEVKRQISTLFNPGIVREAMRQIDLVAGMPGLADVALFDRMADLVLNRSNAYDLTVFDTAPTGHTLRLLHMPEAMAAWVQALSDRRRQALEVDQRTTAGQGFPSTRLETERRGSLRASSPADKDPILQSLTRRRARLASVRDHLTRYDTTAFVLVLIPERLPIEESARAVRELEHAHLHVAAVVVNRVLPEDLTGAYYEARKAQERVYLEEIDRRFRGVPRVRVPQLESDVHGLQSLERVGESLMGG